MYIYMYMLYGNHVKKPVILKRFENYLFIGNSNV